ncbi:MFS transporter [Cerasibacillus terrae]|uniref:MFS transporter n=1 Tax=Cerasibacillus terrae TaxID=2498845 RepID=A0A5C8NWT5_9BACI|nr:MFS transporter [Cerasibacillus terrae]TXL65697.1 MFS transporter [Cerasibacillus terrae]
MNTRWGEWKSLAILLASIGIAGVGDFIYLVAINIIVYQMTGSAAAVAGLWIISPITNIITKFWTGSYIDYRSKRKIMIITYLIRAIFIALIPFAPNMVVIYSILVCLSVAKAFFGPASMTYVTMLVPQSKRKRFNAIRSFTTSSAFIVGPAIGGTLILLTSVNMTLWLNACLFILAAILLIFLPQGETISKESIPKLTLKQVIADFTVVADFISKNRYISFVYMGYILILLFSYAMDAQEVVFTQQVVGLSEIEYSLLISITGIGSVIGAVILSFFSHKFSLRYLIVIGIGMSSVGYIIYAFSWSFGSIATGFIILGFFNVYANTGITTFYQNNIPVNVMGRVTSIFQLIQSSLQVVFILAVGIAADIIPLRTTIIVSAISMFFTTVIFSIAVFLPRKRRFYV